MGKGPQLIDITGSPELLRLAEEVQRSGVDRLLVQGERELALLTPVAPRGMASPRSRRLPADAEHDSILNIIGIGASAEPTDIARHERDYLAEAYTPRPR